MSRCLLLLALALTLLLPGFLPAQEAGPVISITSPDAASTFVYATIKNHSLIWSRKYKLLSARVTFTDAQQNIGQSNDDTHFFKLPGVTFDEVKGVFFATAANGESVPVAHIKKTLFIKSIETLPNAAVRIIRQKGNVTVILEAIRANDPSLQPSKSDPDGTHKVDINQMIN